jgi:hypothetical protein
MNRDFAGHVFERIGLIEPERDASGAVREFMPQSRYRNARALPLNDHGSGPFCRSTIARDIHRPGVYVITLVDQPVYVGKCHNLAQRFGPQGYGAIQPKNCFVGGQPTNCKVNNLILQHARQGQSMELWFRATSELAPVERDVIVKIRPPWNTQVPR